MNAKVLISTTCAALAAAFTFYFVSSPHTTTRETVAQHEFMDSASGFHIVKSVKTDGHLYTEMHGQNGTSIGGSIDFDTFSPDAVRKETVEPDLIDDLTNQALTQIYRQLSRRFISRWHDI